MNDRVEVCSFAREVMLPVWLHTRMEFWAQPLSFLLPESLRFLHLPLPTGPSASLAARFPCFDLPQDLSFRT